MLLYIDLRYDIDNSALRFMACIKLRAISLAYAPETRMGMIVGAEIIKV
jgi:hypothetical protein